MNVYAYLRVSGDKQDVAAQRTAIVEYAVKHGFKLIFTEDSVSSRVEWDKRKIGALVKKLEAGDILITSDTTRAARSALEILQIEQEIIRKNAEFHIVNEGLVFSPPKGNDDEINTVMKEFMLAVLGQAGKLTRAFIRKKTKEGIDAARQAGKQIGRPEGKAELLLLDKEGRYERILDQISRRNTLESIRRNVPKDTDEKPPSRNTVIAWLTHWDINLKEWRNLNDEELKRRVREKRKEIAAYVTKKEKAA